MGLPFIIVTLHADEGTLRIRIQQRRGDASEADEDVLMQLQASQQPLTEQERKAGLSFDTTQAPQSGQNARSWKRLLEIVRAG